MKKVIGKSTITFSFEGLESVIFDTEKVSAENRNYAALHGFAARIGDHAAITRSAENGFTVTEAMRRAAVLEMVEHFQSGTTDWNLRVAVRKPVFNPAIQAIADKLGKSYEEALAWYNAKLLAELESM